MRMLKIAVIVMGVLIVGGTVTLALLIVQRASGGSAMAGAQASLPLQEPEGTRIVGIAALGDRLAVQLQGGGPDRVVLIDARSLRPVGRVSLLK